MARGQKAMADGPGEGHEESTRRRSGRTRIPNVPYVGDNEADEPSERETSHPSRGGRRQSATPRGRSRRSSSQGPTDTTAIASDDSSLGSLERPHKRATSRSLPPSKRRGDQSLEAVIEGNSSGEDMEAAASNDGGRGKRRASMAKSDATNDPSRCAFTFAVDRYILTALVSQEKTGGDPWQTPKFCHPHTKGIEVAVTEFINGALGTTLEVWKEKNDKHYKEAERFFDSCTPRAIKDNYGMISGGPVYPGINFLRRVELLPQKRLSHLKKVYDIYKRKTGPGLSGSGTLSGMGDMSSEDIRKGAKAAGMPPTDYRSLCDEAKKLNDPEVFEVYEMAKKLIDTRCAVYDIVMTREEKSLNKKQQEAFEKAKMKKAKESDKEVLCTQSFMSADESSSYLNVGPPAENDTTNYDSLDDGEGLESQVDVDGGDRGPDFTSPRTGEAKAVAHIMVAMKGGGNDAKREDLAAKRAELKETCRDQRAPYASQMTAIANQLAQNKTTAAEDELVKSLAEERKHKVVGVALDNAERFQRLFPGLPLPATVKEALGLGDEEEGD